RAVLSDAAARALVRLVFVTAAARAVGTSNRHRSTRRAVRAGRGLRGVPTDPALSPVADQAHVRAAVPAGVPRAAESRRGRATAAGWCGQRGGHGCAHRPAASDAHRATGGVGPVTDPVGPDGVGTAAGVLGCAAGRAGRGRTAPALA